MLQKFFKSKSENKSDLDQVNYRWWDLLALPAWVIVCFFISEMFVSGLDIALSYFRVNSIVSPTIYNSITTFLVYVLVISLVIIVPRYVPKLKRYRISKETLGISRYPTWKDILVVPAGLITYFVLSSVLILVANYFLPWIDINQTQNIGFNNISVNIEYIFAFVTLLVVVPLAEETLFRGYLYGKLRKSLPMWLAIVAVSLLFGGLHGAWNVAIDTFALSVVLCFLRESTGSIWSSVLLHMTKNGVAFYFLFINPAILHTLGR